MASNRPCEQGAFFMVDTLSHISQFEAIFAKELTPELASVYVASLAEKLGGPNQELAEIVKRGELLHQHVGETIYGPLIAGYVQWVEAMCGEVSHTGPVYFALRDALPLKTAADVLWDGKAIYPVGVYANRPMLMIEDEIAPEWANANGKVVQYLGMLGLAGMKKVVWSDTGAWGTVVKALKVGLLNDADYLPLFWYSHNPHISGYVNTLLAECRINDKFGEILNDSLECVFPQPHVRPLDVVSGPTGWQVKLELSCYLSQVWGNAALLGVNNAAHKVRAEGGISLEAQIRSLQHLYSLHEIAKTTGQWTGVLPVNTPTWSLGPEFINAWPEGLLP